MAEHIPFITSEDACNIVTKVYPDSDYVRVPLDRAARFRKLLPPRMKLWIDPLVEGLDDLPTRRPTPTRRKKPWHDFMKKFPHMERIAEPTFHQRPDRGAVKEFVRTILGECAKMKPAWISVPQLPVGDGNERNKINRALATATGSWKARSGFTGRLILPLVFTHQRQLKGKTVRNPKVKLAERCYREAQAEGIWVVDGNVTDDNGSATLHNVRFPAIVALHEELNGKIVSALRVAGPYWGMNLVLWARRLVDYPAIGVGNAYRYHLAGGPVRQPSARLALGPLRRRSGVGQLRDWLDKVISVLGVSHPAHAGFAELRKNFSVLRDQDRAREQVAIFYKKWFDSIAATPSPGRSMALFQDLSSSYALGKSLPEIPGEGTARRPESVAEPLMLSCL